jgi:hypothetical protein
MKTNKKKLSKEAVERLFQFWNPYIDQVEKETTQAVDGGYLEFIYQHCRVIQQHPFIHDLVCMKDQIENPEGHMEYKKYGMWNPDYCKESIKYWEGELKNHQEGIAEETKKLKKLEKQVLSK